MRQYIKERPKRAIDVFTNLYNSSSSRTVDCTYYDKECTKVAVYLNKFRSFDSLYEIAKGYFPTLTEVGFLKQLNEQGKAYLIGCDYIKKVTVGYNKSRPISRHLFHRFSGNSVGYYVTEFKQKYAEKI